MTVRTAHNLEQIFCHKWGVISRIMLYMAVGVHCSTLLPGEQGRKTYNSLNVFGRRTAIGRWAMDDRRNYSAMSLRAVFLAVTIQPCHCEPFFGEAISRLSGQLDRLVIASSQRTLLAMTSQTVLRQG
jgi:hypothetical protein